MIIIANQKAEIKRLLKEFIKNSLITECAIFVDEGLKESKVIENRIEKIAFKHTKSIAFDSAENAIDDILNDCSNEDLYCIPCAVAGLFIKFER